MRLYTKIKDYICKNIDGQLWQEGDQIPTEEELAKQFGVSRPTVRQAMSDLVNLGYLKRISGKGTFVQRPKVVQEYTRFIESYNSEMQKKGLTPKTVQLSLHVEHADPFIAMQLKIKPREKVIYLRRLRFANGSGEQRPVLLTEVYIPYCLAPQILDYDFEKYSLYDILQRLKLSPKRVIREIEAIMPDRHTAALLEISENEPVHYITSTGFLGNGSVIEYSRSIYPSTRNKFVVEITAAD